MFATTIVNKTLTLRCLDVL